MKYRILLLLLIVSNLSFANDNFLDTITLDQIKRIYPNDNVVSPSSYTISMNFDLNRYRLNEPITMEIKIYAKKGTISFTNSVNPFNNYSFTVYDNYNNPVVSSDNYTMWKYKNERTLDNSQDRIVTLNEGESFSYYIDLNNWFHFDKIGRYRIECSFNPIPEISDNFSMHADTAYFLLENARVYQTQTNSAPVYITNNNNNNNMPQNQGVLYDYSPSSIISNTLFAMKNKDWTNYYTYMHMPSIISISQRYYETYRSNYSNAYLEDFTDTGIQQKARQLSFENFLRTQFSDTVSAEMLRTNFGNNFLNNLEMAYKSSNIRELAIRFDILYRTSLPEDRKLLFEEFKKYLTSAYDRQVRNTFIAELQRDIIATKDAKLREHYTAVLDMIKKEYDPAVTYTLLNYTIDKTTVTQEYGLQKAEVEATLYHRYFNADTGDIYDPVVKRTFVLRRMGEYWYIVNYYDTVVNN
ncbi:hypothetical protein [Brachyspira hyodysenteriae]|uniref:hypothetical protein n=1 Tax=Brachyspira hyodysenteriae TaxID=159 RepID=UPI0022CD3D1B|nr:hypothetical protein [Brachyspira hyodysenteriae]MCZ9851018.1 hypothetical protein [Brachyspira hyodysenteriae]MCZ9860230.1 hypothetical protein [Brachyspira hyodysenteriae]MCZ9891775.1 hypothetical protein [Brachyspira hyodysenteriae]MCZ9895909.1 hypothetical protein [Brachyspira hyodysenteriae]MCZ9916716.1 hypothetical protein [Brachyspira hyodysenteriae]